VFETLSREKEKAIRAYVIFSVLFFIAAVGIGFVISAERGYGSFPWNSATRVSCYTPGGPYYSSQRPRSEQHCPDTTSSGVIARRKEG
jgi:hypothetical protein